MEYERMGRSVRRGLAVWLSLLLVLVSAPAFTQDAAEEEQEAAEGELVNEGAVVVDGEAPADPGDGQVVDEAPAEDAAPAEEAPAEEAPPEEEAPAPPAPRVVPPRPGPPRTSPRQLPIRRQNQPEAPNIPGPGNGNPNQPPMGLKAEDPFMISTDGTQLVNIIKSVAALTGKNFFFDPQVGQTEITVISHEEFPPAMAFEFLESLLAANGLSVVETLDENLYHILPVGTSPEKYPLETSGKLPPEGYDRFFTYVIAVVHADASEIADLMKRVGSTGSTVDVYPKTNTLLITDTADGIRNMFKLLEVVDQPGFETETEIFVLQYTRAEQLREQIEQVLLGTGDAGAAGQQQVVPPRPTGTRVRPSTTTNATQAKAEVHGTREEVLRMVTDERLNALIVVATPNMMEGTRELIDALDTPTPFEANTMHYVPLQYADAELVEEALSAVTGTAPRGSAPGAGAAPSGRGGGGGGGGGGSEAASTEVQPFEKKVLITRYETTNALVIVASPQDFKLLNELIAKLDVPQRQVNVESIILEVVINNDYQLSINTAWYDNLDDGFALNNTIDLVNVIANGPVESGGAGFLGGVIDGTVEVQRFVEGTDGAAPTVVTELIPNIPLIIRALESITDLDVLSQPSLTTVDNMPAQISVGQQIPVPATLSDTDDRTGFRTRSSIERKDVGVKLNVTPQINEGDYVSLEAEVEVSQPITSEIGVDPNELGATFQRSFIQNEVVVKDGSTAIMGGLISESRDSTRQQTPILGDIPVLGFFFRSKGVDRRKRNLIVMLTPHIVKEGDDMERLVGARLDQFSERNFDVLLDQGFIQKVKQKQDLRNKFSPSKRTREDLMDRNRFGRDELPRND